MKMCQADLLEWIFQLAYPILSPNISIKIYSLNEDSNNHSIKAAAVKFFHLFKCEAGLR